MMKQKEKQCTSRMQDQPAGEDGMGWREKWRVLTHRNNVGKTYVYVERWITTQQRWSNESTIPVDDMPTPDRIALARELLAGTGYIAAKPPRGMGSRRSWEYAHGWNDCVTKLLCGQADARAAMLRDGDAGEGV